GLAVDLVLCGASLPSYDTASLRLRMPTVVPLMAPPPLSPTPPEPFCCCFCCCCWPELSPSSSSATTRYISSTICTSRYTSSGQSARQSSHSRCSICSRIHFHRFSTYLSRWGWPVPLIYATMLAVTVDTAPSPVMP